MLQLNSNIENPSKLCENRAPTVRLRLPGRAIKIQEYSLLREWTTNTKNSHRRTSVRFIRSPCIVWYCMLLVIFFSPALATHIHVADLPSPIWSIGIMLPSILKNWLHLFSSVPFQNVTLHALRKGLFIYFVIQFGDLRRLPTPAHVIL